MAREIGNELKRFRENEEAYIPDNYLFYTNVALTPVRNKGLKDKINAYVEMNNDIIKNFYVLGYDEICALLDNNRDVATAYGDFILPGDILSRIFGKYFFEDYENDFEWVKKYLYCEFQEEMYTRMEQAGSATEKKISLEKVCVDINVQDCGHGEVIKFAEYIFSLGNQILGYKKKENGVDLKREENFVLIGGPGNGKSTICQFIAQIYRADYLQAVEYEDSDLREFSDEIKKRYKYQITHRRIPFKVVLRDYAAWINQKGGSEGVSLLQYMRDKIRRIEGDDVSIEDLRSLLKECAFIFFFDGLDEVPESSNREEVLKQIQIFISLELREASCDCMIIGTTRAQGYNNDFDKKRYQLMEIAEFSKEDCYRYIQRLFDVMEEQTDRREEYVQLMKEALDDETTSRLMKTPLQATIIAILVKSGGKPPHERYSLFHQYYDIVIRREKQKGVVATLNDYTDWLDELHHFLGYRLQCESEKEDNPSAEISKSALEEAICTYVEENGDEFYELECELEEKKREFLLIITQRVCFLNENREGFYSFTIRSLQEYFAGTYLVKGKSDQEAIKGIRKIAFHSYWRNVLLFALGYIELERKSLEPEIYIMCGKMNGNGNVMQEDFTSENLCLFGSWLAADILAENIFRGKQQEKYIALASKVIGFSDCPDYHIFRQIIGIQKDKLLRYVKENFCRDEEGRAKVLRLCLELKENNKNDLEAEIMDILEQLSPKQQTIFCLFILENPVNISGRIMKAAECRIVHALEQGEIKYFLPYHVLRRVSSPREGGLSLELRKNLFLQCLFSKEKYLNMEEVWGRLGIQCDVATFWRVLSSDNHRYLRGVGDTIGVTDSFVIRIYNNVVNKKQLRIIQRELKKLELNYLLLFCDFLLEPSLAKYLALHMQLDREEEYVAKKYRSLLKYYVPERKFDTEEEFEQINQRKREDFRKLIKGEYRELYFKKTSVYYESIILEMDGTFDNLAEREGMILENIELLSSRFFKVVVNAAVAQITGMEKMGDVREKTFERLQKLICEAERRNFYGYHMVIIPAVLIASKFKKRFWESNPDFGLADKMLEEEMLGEGSLKIGFPHIELEELRNIIGGIVGKILYEGKESNYLSI